METLTEASVISRLKEIIVEDLATNVPAEEIDEHTSLFEEGIGLDSISIVNLIVLIENEFDVGLEEDKIDSETFANLTTLSGYIMERKLASAAN